MALSSYSNGLKRLHETLRPVAEHYGRPALYFWLDALLAHLRYGVTPNQYIGFRFYAKSALERREFYTFRQHKRFERALNAPEHYETFWDKAKFNAVFSDFVRRDWLDCVAATPEQIERFVREHEKLIVKPAGGSSGKGIHMYAGETAEALTQQQALLEQFVCQHPALSALNPSSVNTVRVYTILDRAGAAHVLSASLRVGGAGSPVDNFHSGGVGYPLDVEHGAVKAAGKTMLGEPCLYHPGTGAKVIGFEIPNWQALLDFVFRAARKLPTARMIAWDVAVLPDGFEMIEGNCNGDPGFMQTPSETGKRREILRYL